ncbi:hypothetical protein [Tenacibaculum amylolyticum]|uniref:hypothetical protein n=1 Tax=Tenacibaculum amylolyticum TaxID=104269 RepID=UPI003893F0C8
MKTNEEALESYGKIIVSEVFDQSYQGLNKIIYEGTPNPLNKKYHDFFNKLSQSDKDLLREYSVKNITNVIFDMLKVFEENENFKLVYQESEKQVNLVEVSEMLSAEPVSEYGWIAKFSKYVKDNEII